MDWSYINSLSIDAPYSTSLTVANGQNTFNIVGHSMGGLVARYYIENLYQDNHVEKLITICTPHWGSGYADLSNITGFSHVLCDHDLDFDSAMYGKSTNTTIDCDLVLGHCPDDEYTVTDALNYNRQRSTKYYAIAAVDYNADTMDENDFTFEMSTSFNTYQSITDLMSEKNIYKISTYDFEELDPKNEGDNIVGLLSQIGWTDNSGDAPNKRIQMEKIFIDVDTNGGNGDGGFIWEVVDGLGSEIFHSKMPHRIPVISKVIEYLR